MKAVLLTDYGDVDNLVLSDVPAPKAGPGEIKVHVQGASINPVDYKLRRGDLRSFMPLSLPAILGRDAAGDVIEVGEGVTSFAVGDRVMGLLQQAYAEIVVGPAEAFAKLPPELEAVEAAALPLVGLTGAQLAEEAVAPNAGDLVLVTGALGAVGRVAVFAAKKRGAKVIAGVRANQRTQAEELDVDQIVALDDANEIGKLPMLDAIADTVDGAVIESVLFKLKPGGVLGSVLGAPKGATGRDIVVRAIMTHPDSKRLAALGESFAQGELQLPLEEPQKLSDVRDAHRLAEQHGVGKVVLVP